MNLELASLVFHIGRFSSTPHGIVMADGDNTAVFGDSYRLTGRCQLVPKGDDNAGPAREPEVNEKLFGKGRETWGLWD